MRFTAALLLILTLASCKKDGTSLLSERNQWNSWCQDTVVCWGDSHTFGYGVNDPRSWPTMLSEQIGLVVLNGGVSGQTSDQIRARYMADVPNQSKPRIIFAGANNAWHQPDVFRDIDSMVKVGGNDKYLVMGMLLMNYYLAWKQDPTIYNGDLTPGHNMHYWCLEYIDSTLEAKYPGHVFRPVPYLIKYGNDGSAADSLNIYHGIAPASCMGSDMIHLNEKGNRLLADTLARLIRSCKIKPESLNVLN